MQTGTSGVTTDSNQRLTHSAAPKPNLLDQVRQAIGARHYSKRTEKTYAEWIKRFILFHSKRHPLEMGEPEINQFLTDLAVNKKVSASTQNQALSAILFLYQRVLDKPLEWVNPAVRAKKPKRLPVVLTRQEVKTILDSMGASQLELDYAKRTCWIRGLYRAV
jgi:site-specific recombinase XerD